MSSGVVDSGMIDEVVDSYPITYRVRPWIRLLAAGFAVALACLLLALLTGSFHVDRSGLAFGLFAFAAAFAVYGVAWAFTACITIRADCFEQRKPFVHRALTVTEIEGRRYTRAPGAGYPVIVPKTGAPFSIDSVSYGLDRRFDRWFLRLKDLD